MANLNGQNIGTNYKGIINIGSTVNQNVSASLQSLTDGDGNNLPIQVSTAQISIGGGTGTGRLVVRGDGTNLIFRAENGAGSSVIQINNTGNIDAQSFSLAGNSNITYNGGNATTVFTGGRYFSFQGNLSGGAIFTVQNLAAGVISATSGTNALIHSFANVTPSAGSGNLRLYSAVYTINASGAQTGTITGYFLNATETNLNGTTHNLMDLQVGGVSQFRVDRAGTVTAGSLNTSLIVLPSTQFRFSGSCGILTNSPGNINMVSGVSSRSFSVSSSTTGTPSGTIFLYAGPTALGLSIGTDVNNTTSRLLVRGDGTNPIVRFENSSGTARLTVSDNGGINMSALPTSPAGLSAGDLWNNGGVLNIV